MSAPLMRCRVCDTEYMIVEDWHNPASLYFYTRGYQSRLVQCAACAQRIVITCAPDVVSFIKSEESHEPDATD